MSIKDLNLKVKHVFQFTTPALAVAAGASTLVVNVGNITPAGISANVPAATIANYIQYTNQFSITPLVVATVGVQGPGDYVINAVVPGTSFTVKSLNNAETSTLQVTMNVYEAIY